ncbi:ribonuclease J [Nioella sediminis]|jgi:ribonuclease J|uniref:ribonuclease J n=1 Tax=Nioella sediminis TaxID=1912092 RepID=UPI0008FD8372|nr:ribonuclease J [Nioella sediminis]TBX29361.1 metallo-beta-lactamase [Roseovarius sp. JS7-11]
MTSSPRLIYLPLGGAGEIGMNCYLYGYGPQGDERFILVDVGVSFPDMDGTPGVDLILPDIAWIAERADRLDGIFITHAHEDHVGALGHLYRHFRKVPVFARPFTAAIATRKMEEAGQDPAMVQVAPVWPETVQAGPFTVGFAPTSHSIPEASALVIDSPEGRVVHSGDFKIDPDPRVGEPFDPAMWEEIGKTGVRALICDSTNVFSRHAGRSESDLPEPITKLVAEARGMVVATTFASNIARVKTLAEAGRAAGRSVCLMGRAMKRMVTVAVETGVLTDFPSTISPEEATQVPRENLMLIVTGSQGERRAASAALSRGKYLGHELKEGDTFLFSSKTIPGNEVSVGRIQNALSEIGVDIVDEQSGFYHVSGHANRPDLERMHGLLKPQILVPNHGEHRHLREHCKVGAAGGMTPVLAPNGSMVDLSGNKPGIVEHVDVTRAYLDGSRVIGALDGVVRDRMKLALNGLVIVALIIDEEDEPLEDCWVELRGLPEMVGNQSLSEMIEDQLAEMFPRLTHKMVMHDDKLQDEVKRVVRQVCVSEIGRKPEVTTIISRLMAG